MATFLQQVQWHEVIPLFRWAHLYTTTLIPSYLSTRDDAMKRMMIQNWSRTNRSERVKNIAETLDHSGKVEIHYFKGRSYRTTLLLGEGHPKIVDPDDEWNYLKVTYQGKDAFDIFDSDTGPIGRFFDWKFEEDEIQQIEETLDHAKVTVREVFMWGNRPFVLFLEFAVAVESIVVIHEFLSRDPGWLLGHCVILLIYLLFLLVFTQEAVL